MADEVSICNMALANIGASPDLESLTENSVSATYCNLYYATSVQETLTSRPWRFARRTVELTATAGSSPTAVPWVYQYEKPAAALKVNKILPESRDGRPEPFEVQQNSAGTSDIVWTDVPEAWAEITVSITDENLFPAHFVTALSWNISAKIAMPVRGDPKAAQAALGMFRSSLVSAGATDGSEASRRPEPEADWIAGRS